MAWLTTTRRNQPQNGASPRYCLNFRNTVMNASWVTSCAVSLQLQTRYATEKAGRWNLR